MGFNSFNGVDKTRKDRENKYTNVKGHSSNWSSITEKLKKLYGWGNKNAITDWNKFHAIIEEEPDIKKNLHIVEKPSLKEMVKLNGLIGNSQYIIDFGDGKYGFADIPNNKTLLIARNLKDYSAEFDRWDFLNGNIEASAISYDDTLPIEFSSYTFYHVGVKNYFKIMPNPANGEFELMWNKELEIYRRKENEQV